MKLESPKVIIDKPIAETHQYLSDVKNFEALMPESIEKFEVLDTDKFLFQLKGMPEIILKKRETLPPNKIVLGAAGGKIDFVLAAELKVLEESKTEVELIFEGDFNPMMAMMIKKPIRKFIETLAENMPEAVNTSK